MELATLGRMAIARWWLIVAAVIAGTVIGQVVTLQYNRGSHAVFRAEAQVVIPSANTEEDSRDGPAPGDDLQEVLALAREVNEEVLGPHRQVLLNEEESSLAFVALERTEEAALEGAEAMRTTYIEADQRFGPQAQLDAARAERETLLERLAELQPPTSTTTTTTIAAAQEAEKQAQIDFIQGQLAALGGKVSQLASERLAQTDEGEIAAIDEELEAIRVQMVELQTQLLPLQPTETTTTTSASTTLPPDDEWEVAAIEARLAELQTEVSAAILTQITGETTLLPEATADDVSPQDIQPILGAAAGVLIALLILAATLVIAYRARRPIWHVDNIEGYPVLAELPVEGLSATGIGQPTRNRRRSGVQAIRSAILGASPSAAGTAVRIITPRSTQPQASTDLALDLAKSLAQVGRSVVVIDTATEAGGQSRVDRTVRLGLNGLADPVIGDDATIERRVAAVLRDAEVQPPQIAYLFSETGIADAVDFLASKPFGMLLGRARTTHDFVLVVGPGASGHGPTEADPTREQEIVVCTRGRTTADELSSLRQPTTSRKTQLSGVVLLTKSSRGPIPWITPAYWMERRASITVDDRLPPAMTSPGNEVDREREPADRP
jgi:hypothetical protein